MPAKASSIDHSWHIVQRWQQYEGEARVNMLRIIAIGIFYLIHLWAYFSSQGSLPDWGILQLAKQGEISTDFHIMVSFLALAWIMLAAAIHLALRSRIFPQWMPRMSTLCDVMFLTSILCVSRGPQSPLVVGYFLILALAALRFDVRLVQIATAASVAGYLCLLGCAKWPETFLKNEKLNISVPRYEQLVVIAGLALTGIILGQVVRRVRSMAEDYAERSIQGS